MSYAQQQQIADLQNKLNTANATANSLKTQLATANANLNTANQKVASLNSQLNVANQKVQSLTVTNAALTARLTQATTDLGVANATLANFKKFNTLMGTPPLPPK